MFSKSSLRTLEGTHELFCIQESLSGQQVKSKMLMDGGDICTQSQLTWPIQFVWFWYSWVIKDDLSPSQLSTQEFGQSLEHGSMDLSRSPYLRYRGE